MQVTYLSDVAPRPRQVAVGEFDGVHIGHRAVIDANDTVLTFEPHPAVVVHPERAPKLLTSLELKAELVADLGVRELVVVPFDQGFANQTPQEFIDNVLVRSLGATRVSVGENFRFGHDTTGSPDLLAADSRFETTVVPLVAGDGQTISSSRIRELVSAGEVRHAASLLGAPFRLRGTVVRGAQLGAKLGFPTANIVPEERLVCPANGVYACRVDGRPAAVNVGIRPTFGTGLERLVEAHLLDFSGDLYGQVLTIGFLSHLRDEVRFENADELVVQMRRDVARTRELVAC